MICNIRDLHREIGRQRLLYGHIPGLDIRIFIVFRNNGVLLANKIWRTRRYDPAGRDDNGDGSREACLEGCYLSIAKQRWRIGGVPSWLVAVVGANGIIECITIVWQSSVADPEPAADHRVICGAISKTGPRSKVPVSRLHSQVHG